MRRFLLALMLFLLAAAVGAKDAPREPAATTPAETQDSAAPAGRRGSESPTPTTAAAEAKPRPAPDKAEPAEQAQPDDEEGDAPETQPHSAGEDRNEALARARKVLRLHLQSVELAKKGKFVECEPLLLESLKIDPDNEITWYNMACVHSRLDRPAKAIEAMNKALDVGYSDFRYMEQDPDLGPLRKLAGYRAILKRNAEIQRSRAEKIESQLKERFGEGYICEIDHPRKLVFATNVDRKTLDELKTYLTAYAEAMWGQLFTHRFEQYVTVVVPDAADAAKNMHVAGYYTHAARMLVARQIGMVMTHEFTHALHDADQDGLGQRHPIWVTEGLATLFESSEIRGGRVVPLPNERLILLNRLAGGKKTIDFKDFFKISHEEFMKRSAVAYPQARYVMMYLHELGVLRKWYDLYTAEHDEDATGAAAMEKALGKPLDEIETDWLAWVKAQNLPTLRLRPGAAYIGVRTRGRHDGLEIVEVVAGSGADAAGLKAGDVIVKVDGQRMVEGGALIRIVSARKVGDELAVQVRRDGSYRNVTVTLGRLPRSSPRTTPAPKPQTEPATKPKTEPATAPAKKKAA